MRRAMPAVFLSLTALVATSSCSSSTNGGNGATCSAASPCGGTIVGTWTIVSACATGTMQMPSTACPGETATITSVNDSGSLTFNADGTYTGTINSSAQESIMLPMSCLSMGGTTVTCDQIGMALSGPLVAPDGGPGPGTESASCSSSSSACNCNVSVSVSGIMASGTYATAGSNVTLTPNGGSSTTDGYCVQGNNLRLFSAVGAAMTGGSMPPAELLATKQ